MMAMNGPTKRINRGEVDCAPVEVQFALTDAVSALDHGAVDVVFAVDVPCDCHDGCGETLCCSDPNYLSVNDLPQVVTDWLVQARSTPGWSEPHITQQQGDIIFEWWHKDRLATVEFDSESNFTTGEYWCFEKGTNNQCGGNAFDMAATTVIFNGWFLL